MKLNLRYPAMSVALFAWFNLLPYLGRFLWGGAKWAGEYVPGNSVSGVAIGILFFHFFHSLPVLPLVQRLQKDKPGVLWILIFIGVSALVGWSHASLDLRSDAQAAIGILFIPVLGMLAAYLVLLPADLSRYIVRMMKAK